MEDASSFSRVLLVVDRASDAEPLQRALHSVADEIVAESTKRGALDRLTQLRFAAIVVDAGHADAQLHETVESMRGTPLAKKTPIVLIGPPRPDSAFLVDVFALGAVDYLERPVDVAALDAKVRGLVDLFRLAERAERESEQFRMMVQGIRDYAIFMLDTDGRIASWNEGAKLLKGYEAEEILGSHLSRFYPPDVVETGWVEHELRMAAAAGRFEDEGWRVRKDGSRFWANVVITALYDDNDELRGYAKITRDLTARKEAEEAARRLAEETAARRAAEANSAQLSEERERLRVTLASIGDGVITTDRHGRVEFMNPVAESLTGWSRFDASGEPLSTVFEIVNETTRLPVENPAVRALESGETIGLANHTVLIARDRSECFIDDSAAPIRDASGMIVGSVLVFRDIGARRAAERQRGARAAAIQALAAAESLADGIEGVLAAICTHMGWDAGLFWELDANGGSLRCTGAHTDGEPANRAFVQESRALAFERGSSLPGRVWDSGTSCWLVDFVADPGVVRSSQARDAGLHSAFACPVTLGDRFLGVVEFFSARMAEPDPGLLEMADTVAAALGHFIGRRRTERELAQQTFNAEALLRVVNLLGHETDLHNLVQVVTDEATKLCGAQFGAFFYNLVDESGESYTLYTLSGMPRSAFENFPMPRNTAVFGPTFNGRDAVRFDDVTQAPQYGRNAPYHGMPEGHPPVRSYLAAAVVSRSGTVHGGLFFGHSEPGRFTAQHEELIKGVASQAAIAIDNAQLFQSVQDSAERLNLALSAAELGDWSWDAATDVVGLSPRAAAIFGLEAGMRITWKEMQKLLHPDDQARARAEVERVIAERVQYDIQYRVVHSGGEMVWVGALGRAVYDAAGQVTGMYGVVQDISERKRLEQSLGDSEARFRSLMEQAPFSIQVLSPDGRTLRVNKAWEDLWGVTLEQLGDYNMLEDAQLDARGVMPQIRAAFAGTPSVIPAIRYDPNETIPNQTRHADPVRWVAAVAYPIKDDEGVVQEVVLVHEDVTASRRAQHALVNSEERLRMALEAGQMGVWDWNVATGKLEWSDTLEPLHGLQPGEFEGTFEHFLRLVHPQDRAMLTSTIEGALERRGSFYTEFRNPRRDGDIRWIAGSGKVFVDESGAPVRMIGIGLDVTQRRREEQTARFLAAASAELAEIVDFESTLQKVAGLAVPSFADWAAVDILEDDGELRRVAVAHADEARIRLAAEIHRRLPRDPEAAAGVWRVLRTGKPELLPEITDAQLEASGADAETLDLLRQLGLRSYIGVPLTVRGTVRGVLTFVVDESGHTYDEADLELAQELAHRTAVAIENAELYQELRDADRQKDEFLATLAHELRNPLAPIRTGLHVVRLHGSDEPALGKALTMMERQVDHLVRLVDDLLDVSRITRDRLELRLEPVLLADAIHGAVEASQHLFQRANHALSVRLPDEPVVLLADRVRVAQIVSNLLNNAAKYSPAGGRVALSAEIEGSEIVVRVRDNGLGIPSESLSTIFEMFSQVDRGGATSQGGLGIGLTLVKRLVQLHGGSVEALSEGPGKGSEFVVRLPIRGSAGQPSTGGAMPAPGESLPQRILVVDDNADAARTLEMMLSLMGHEVRVCLDGADAIVAARQFRPQLVLLDIGLPGMNGYEVCRRLRSDPSVGTPLVVAVTGWGKDADRRRSEEAGFNEHLVKPVSVEQLEQLLHRSQSRS